ncbi:MAG TPA: tRNA (guanosine(37)-N1)-methyltransferase TrmD [Candidatus Avacidaminococcus intestinavium]|uniref:tRNA (guanine-N(1)-)-methyltransferase n=1 Tax=Candidatus Avacidaminococcus intestinavium TaxID=2840684 RepID=A0A9D1MMX9_9FIRM|nr:tRNA (guanosine(37)-N1)-methyltransferase TrmD [Candidatus Avacidaminococcus intestinavium]
MRFTFITLFPEFIKQATEFSIIKRAIDSGRIEVAWVNPRDFTEDKHNTVDDTPFGGGAGMVLKVEPFYLAIQQAKKSMPNAKVIALCPGGTTFSQHKANELAHEYEEAIFLCGHYEGFDERIFCWVDEIISIGDYVLTGGELPALVVLDAVARLIPGVLGKLESTVEESFSDNLLEYAQYTRPVEFKGMIVPPVLREGNHSLIGKWRRKDALKKTLDSRPDLLRRVNLKKEDMALFHEIFDEAKGEKNV